MTIFDNTPLIFTVTYISIGILYYAIAYVEAQNGAIDLFAKKRKDFVTIGVILLIINIFLQFLSFQINKEDVKYYLIVTFIIKIILGTFTSKQASSIGRNKILWWILGFLDYSIAFVILGYSSLLISAKNDAKYRIKELNKETKKKKNAIITAYKDGIINLSEKWNKTKDLEKEYYSKLSETKDFNNQLFEKEKTDILNSKLERAYKSGVITEREYLEKKQ